MHEERGNGKPKASTGPESGGDGHAALPPIPEALFAFGFKAAVGLAFASLLAAAAYLFVYLGRATEVLKAETAPQVLALAVNIIKIVLLSCGVFVGLAFGFLGFGLFLLGIRGEMDVTAQRENLSVKVARISPGVFVIICATILIGVCCTHPIKSTTEGELSPATGARPSSPDNSSGGASQPEGENESTAAPLLNAPFPLSRSTEPAGNKPTERAPDDNPLVKQDPRGRAGKEE